MYFRNNIIHVDDIVAFRISENKSETCGSSRMAIGSLHACFADIAPGWV
jgi:hypothetical protein